MLSCIIITIYYGYITAPQELEVMGSVQSALHQKVNAAFDQIWSVERLQHYLFLALSAVDVFSLLPGSPLSIYWFIQCSTLLSTLVLRLYIE